MSNRFYPTKTPVTTVMMINIRKSEIPTLITQDTENMMSISFANRIKKYLDNECIKINKKIIQMSPSNQNMDFWDFPALSLKKVQKISWSWDNNGKKISTHK